MWCRASIFLLFLVKCHGSGEDEEYRLSIVNLTQTSPDSRIIGGSDTNINRFPYAVQVLYNSQLVCGGSLLTRRHVLSAGHCFVDEWGNQISPRLYSIRAGTNILNSGGVVRAVSVIVIHERYNIPARDNDIAVLLLRSAVTLSDRINTGFIPAQGNWVADNSSVIAIGWGRTNVNIPTASHILQEVTVRTVNLNQCAARYLSLGQQTGEQYLVTNSMLCAGKLDVGGKDACRGDSGGPLIYNGVIVGITSWGYGCAHPLYPGVYARVSSYTNWINDTVWEGTARYNTSPAVTVGFVTTIVPLLYLILFN